MTELLGLPLSMALALLDKRQMTPRICYTKAPRTQDRSGTARVIRVQDETLTVAVFPDQSPQNCHETQSE